MRAKARERFRGNADGATSTDPVPNHPGHGMATGVPEAHRQRAAGRRFPQRPESSSMNSRRGTTLSQQPSGNLKYDIDFMLGPRLRGSEDASCRRVLDFGRGR